MDEPISGMDVFDPPVALERFRKSFTHSSLRVGDTEWSYWRGGSEGPPILWLSGVLGVGELVFPQAVYLAPRFEILLPDYPPLKRLGAIVEGLRSLLDSEQIDAVHLVGGSFGGMIAQHFVRAHPKRVRSLVLSHTTAPHPSRTRAAVMHIVSVLSPERLFRTLVKRRLKSAFEVAGPFWSGYFDAVVGRLGKAALRGRVALTSEFLQTPLSPSCGGRVLIAHSDGDRLMLASRVEALCRLYPGAERHEFVGTGHSAALLRPYEYARIIESFLLGGAS